MATLIERLRFGLTNPIRAVRHVVSKRHFPWVGQGPLQKRRYDSYEQYVKHQREKLDTRGAAWLSEFDERYQTALRERLEESQVVRKGARVLCLAARLGTEVRAFLDLGCFAIGIDLNPGRENKYVVTGDFHCIQYAAGSIDLVFSNSLDHAFDMSRLIAEIQRVLTTDGLVVLEIVDGKREGYDPGYFEACIWESVDDLVDLFVDQGFRVIRRQPITYPWSGQMVCLARANSRAS